MKPKKLTEDLISIVESEVIMMLLSSRDCYRNQGRTIYHFDANDGYYGEAFGIMRALVLLGYCYFGATNTPENIVNAKWWFRNLEDKALDLEAELGLDKALNLYKASNITHKNNLKELLTRTPRRTKFKKDKNEVGLHGLSKEDIEGLCDQ